MSKLEKTIEFLSVSEQSSREVSGYMPDARGLLLTTLLYTGLILSIPLENPALLLLYAVYPIAGAPFCGESFGRIFLKSLIVLPLVALIGVMNPVFDRGASFTVGAVTVSHGWLTFFSLMLRGLLAMQALLMLISAHGFTGMCEALRKIGMPAFMTVQMLMVYRYIRVLLEELQTMQRARKARGYGRNNPGLRMWGVMIGQLFLRTVDRSQRIHRAMLARGFQGYIPRYSACGHKWNKGDTVWLLLWSAVLIAMRFARPELFLLAVS